MGKGKRKRRDLATIEPEVAERHGFETGGLLGHDDTYSVNVTEQVSLSVDVVLACTRIVADLVSDAIVGEYKGNERLPDSRLTLAPMASISRREWLWRAAAMMALYNGFYKWRRFGRDSEGVARTVEPIAPSRVQWESGTSVRIDGERVNPEDLTWVPRMSFPTLTRDMSWLIRLARETIGAAWSADSYRTDFWEKGGVPPWYMSTDQPLTNDQASDMADHIVAARTENPGRPLVVGRGAKPGTLGADMAAEGASVATSRLGTSIARYFGVPAWLVNVPSEAGSLTYSNAGAAGLDLVRYTLQPGYAGPIGDALSAELPGGYLSGRRVVLSLDHLTRGTVLEQAQAYAIATGNRPWMLPSEVRADLHMPMDMALDESGAPAPALEAIA